MKREKRTWKVKLQAETGQTTEREVKAFWDPDHPLTTESVGHAARTAAWFEENKRVDFYPVAVELVRA